MLNFKTVNLICGLGVLVLLIISAGFKYLSINQCIIGVLFIAFLWLILTSIGSFHIRWNYHLKGLHSNKGIAKNQIAITFDDGPHPEFTPRVLALLKEYNAKATFFCIGNQIKEHKELFKQLLEEGHTIGNHTYSHSNQFGFFKTSKVVEELKQTNTVIEEVTGRKVLLYRPAFGVTNPRIRKAVTILKLKVIGWNVRSLDTTKRTQEEVLQRITSKLTKGDIVLLHDTSEKSILVLEQLLLFLKKNNLESVTVDSLLNIDAYA